MSLEEEIKEIRGSSSSSSSKDLSSPEFEMSDIFYFCRKGVESIMDDEVTKRFSPEELESWNLLTRSNYNFQHISLRLTVLWGLGLLIRYCFLLPLRVTLAFTGVGLLVVGTTVVGILPNGRFKNFLSEKVHLMCYRICVRALTAIITYHDSENKPKNGGICVANHTSPIDVIILASDGCYAMVGQVHRGLMGIIQRSMVKACPHIWFERSEVKDRNLVAKRLSDHVEDKTKLPILIFPEGTCINNTSVMMFKKGSFEIGTTMYPVAIKTVHRHQPRFIALHCQEVGGKDYELNMDHVEMFFSPTLMMHKALVGNKLEAIAGMEALGSMYFIHKSLKQIYHYDFKVKEFKAVSGRNIHLGSLDSAATLEKERFSKNFWPDVGDVKPLAIAVDSRLDHFEFRPFDDQKGSGFDLVNVHLFHDASNIVACRTSPSVYSGNREKAFRYIINSGFDLVNVHLFHDASNIVACRTSPSVYSGNREKAFRYIINRLSDNRYTPLPFFMFGDFNFRLDTRSLVQALCSSAEIKTVKKGTNNEEEKMIYKEKDSDHKLVLRIEKKVFEYQHQAAFREENGKAFLKYDKEIDRYNDVVGEEEIKFPPSYPYSEDYSQPTQFMNTRCPAWCDRVLLSHSARHIIHRGEEGESGVIYDTLGSNVCMGDHKVRYCARSRFPVRDWVGG
ncbi:UNVERIFIED_CONTAM: hypothetical protein FKN15_059996 [Acipenser sinensis]